MVNEKWTLHTYAAGDVGNWAGWYEDADGVATAYLRVDGTVLLVEDIQ